MRRLKSWKDSVGDCGASGAAAGAHNATPANDKTINCLFMESDIFRINFFKDIYHCCGKPS